MKKMKLLTLLPLLIAPMMMTGCSSKTVIGILQPVEHAALGAAREGFEQGLKDGGLTNYKIDYRNAGGNDADLNTLAKNLIDSSSLTLGIGTGAAKALQGAEVNAGLSKPLMFTAVTDPVSAGLVKSADNPEGYICGTTDANPVEAQVALVKEFNANASKVGIMYTQTEENSKVQSDQAEVAIKAAGMTTDVKTCSNASDISATAEALVADGVDAIYIPTDNNIAANMNAIKQAVKNKNILVVCGEENLLKQGGHVTLSINYYNLGLATGKMAAQILKGKKKATDFKVEAVPASNCEYVFSTANLTDAGLTMPEAMKNAHTWRDVGNN